MGIAQVTIKSSAYSHTREKISHLFLGRQEKDALKKDVFWHITYIFLIFFYKKRLFDTVAHVVCVYYTDDETAMVIAKFIIYPSQNNRQSVQCSFLNAPKNAVLEMVNVWVYLKNTVRHKTPRVTS